MKVLRQVAPTSEQLKIIGDYKSGPTLIRGAAGSGKTTTALLRLSFLVNRFRARRERLNAAEPVRVLVLTFNRTLRGYIEELTEAQIQIDDGIDLTVSTFGKWSYDLSGGGKVFSGTDSLIHTYARELPLQADFLAEEVDYVLGRYRPEDFNRYLTDKREGRGAKPRVDQSLRARILSEVIEPYRDNKETRGIRDWNDLALDLVDNLRIQPYDIVIVDEAQDFSANQVRAIINHLAEDHTVTFILDAAQRINPRFFVWKEVGLAIPPNATFRLTQNHRNTKEIAVFAKQVIEGLDLTNDGTIPDLNNCDRSGPMPYLSVGRFREQMKYAVSYIQQYVDLRVDSVAFLHPRGGGWFDYVRRELSRCGLLYAEITRESDWPPGAENIALSTIHSAKGLEFDHVIMLGLNDEVLPQTEGAEGGAFETLQRLFAMAIGRAKTSLILGYKPGEEPAILALVKDGTYELVEP